MGNMNINSTGMISSQAAYTAKGEGLKSAKINAPRMIQSPEEMEQTFKKLGDFLKNSLDELRKMTFGETVSPALASPAVGATVGFSSKESAKAAQDAQEFLKIHEKASLS